MVKKTNDLKIINKLEVAGVMLLVFLVLSIISTLTKYPMTPLDYTITIVAGLLNIRLNE